MTETRFGNKNKRSSLSEEKSNQTKKTNTIPKSEMKISTDNDSLGSNHFNEYLKKELTNKNKVLGKRDFVLRLPENKVEQVDDIIANTKNKSISRNKFYEILTDYAILNKEELIHMLNNT